MIPSKSYRIWFSQRNGSTVLCDALSQTGMAGFPREYFNIDINESILKKYEAIDSLDLREKIWKKGTTPNGVFGIKHSMHNERIKNIQKMIMDLEQDEHDYAARFFPDCQHIFLTRRNKIRQAVSWWKAIKDGIWHLKANENFTQNNSFSENQYDFNAIKHLFLEISLRESAIQAYFSKHNIIPLTLTYEDFIQDVDQTILRILEFLKIPVRGKLDIEMNYHKTSNELSEKWVQRFRKDLQEEMKVNIW